MKINKKFLNTVAILGSSATLLSVVSLNNSKPPVESEAENEKQNVNDLENEVSKIEYTINPNPHNIKYLDSLSLISSNYSLIRSNKVTFDKYLDAHIKSVLSIKSNLVETEVNLEQTTDSTQVLVGIKGSDDSVTKYIESNYWAEIDNDFEKFDAYSLIVKENKIVVMAKDKEGAFAAFNTLSWILEQTNGKLIRDLVINDYADTKIRGFIEGYYGVPWSWDDRSSMMTLAGKYKANSYIFAPKDDPYHSVKWDELYPADEIEKMKKTVEAGHYAGVEFTWTVHPWINKTHAIDLQNDYDGEVAKLKAKFKQMYDEVGIRQFGLLADDIDGQPFQLVKKLIEDLVAWGSEDGREVKGFVFVPTKYEGMRDSWSGTVADLQKYQTQLPDNSKVWIVYTGANVFGSVEPGSVNWWANTSGTNRAPLFWLNWPVNDPDYTALNLGPGTMLNSNVDPNKLVGVVTNPMQEGELSKIAISAISSYTWNIKGFDAWKEWKESFYKIAPEAPWALMKLASHMTSTSKDGKRWGVNIDDESKEIRPAINSIKNSLNSNGELNESDKKDLLTEMDAIIEAYEEFMSYSNNQKMKQEIELFGLSLSKIAETIKYGLMSMELLEKLNSYDNDIRLKQAKLFEAYEYADRARESFNYAKHLIRSDLKEGAKPRDKEKIVRPGNQYLEPLAKLILSKINAIKSESGNIKKGNLYVSEQINNSISNPELYVQTSENQNANADIISNIEENDSENLGAAYIGASKIQYLNLKDEAKRTITLKPGKYIGFDLNNVSNITGFNLVLDGKDKDSKSLKKYYSTTFDKINSVPSEVTEDKSFIARYIILFNDSEQDLEFSVNNFEVTRTSHIEQVTKGDKKEKVEKVSNYRVHSQDYNEEMNSYKYLFEDSDFLFVSHSNEGELVIESESSENTLFNEFYIKQDPTHISHALVYVTTYDTNTRMMKNKKMGNLNKADNFFRAPLDKNEIVLKLNIKYQNAKLHLDKIDVLSNFDAIDLTELRTSLEELKEVHKNRTNITFKSNEKIEREIAEAEQLLANQLGYSQIEINRLRNKLIKSKYIYDKKASVDNTNTLNNLVKELEKYSREDLIKRSFNEVNNKLLTLKTLKSIENDTLTNNETLSWIEKISELKSKLVFDKTQLDTYLNLYNSRKDLLEISTSDDYQEDTFNKLTELVNGLDKYYDGSKATFSNKDLSVLGDKLSKLSLEPTEASEIIDRSHLNDEIKLLEKALKLIDQNNILNSNTKTEQQLLNVTAKNIELYSKNALEKRISQIKQIGSKYFKQISKIVKVQLDKFNDKLSLVKPSSKYQNSELLQEFIKSLESSISNLKANKDDLRLDTYLEDYLSIKNTFDNQFNKLLNDVTSALYIKNLYDIEDVQEDIIVQWKLALKQEAEELLNQKLDKFDSKTYSEKVEQLYEKSRRLEELETKKDSLNKMYEDFLAKKEVLKELLENSKTKEQKQNKSYEIYASTTKLVKNIENSLKQNPQDKEEFTKLLDQTNELIDIAHKYSLIESNIDTKTTVSDVVVNKEQEKPQIKEKNNTSNSLVLLVILNSIATFGMFIYFIFKKFKKSKNN
ncbi:beta-N-acetylglucosaminidase domain-containing protein [Mycoplasma sp. OR1901]|uniref:beta-N-acetylglucosaminidase domain-containing protein n=1 Tax=Mycoplasma sp. OR1901 TaxID=2742195 RepID=UPI001581E5CB|nr:beta-N-acetylglucosaminidase domain-containing protein [Mycoplasma sp. OR1901]QKT05379.1 beta-N-acetylglucosaminidase domain-containing protein [Mycoplasma sp. OR1901]